MQSHPKKLVVIIAESALEPLLIDDVMRLGAHGYTVLDARGGGSRGQRHGSWDGDKSVQMEVICEPAIAQSIADHVYATYFSNYAVSLYVAEVAVLRSAKF